MKVSKKTLLVAMIMMTCSLVPAFAFPAKVQPAVEENYQRGSYSLPLFAIGSVLAAVVATKRVIEKAPSLAREHDVDICKAMGVSLGFIAAMGATGGVIGYIIAIPVNYLSE